LRGCSPALQGDRRSGIDMLMQAPDDAVFLGEIS